MNTQELLWKYAEGQCTSIESNNIEKLLANDPTLQSELNSILEVQSVLVGIEPNMPSMRFTKNVMDALPDIYPSEAIEPLVRPIFKKIFWITLAASIGAIFLLPKTGQPSSGGTVLPYVEQLNTGILSAVSQVPDIVMQYFILTLLATTLLVLVDKVFLKRVKVFFLF